MGDWNGFCGTSRRLAAVERGDWLPLIKDVAAIVAKSEPARTTSPRSDYYLSVGSEISEGEGRRADPLRTEETKILKGVTGNAKHW